MHERSVVCSALRVVSYLEFRMGRISYLELCGSGRDRLDAQEVVGSR